MPGFRLAHLSDLHLPPPQLELRGLAPKQWLSLLAWRRRKHRRHRIEVLDAIAADIVGAAPDHIAITGDLTNFATAPEFEAAARWLGRLGDARGVTVSPGNHDALTGRNDIARFQPWQAWLGDAADIAFPMVRRRGDIALINLCSALPTAVHKAQGQIGGTQRERLVHALADAGAAGLFRVVLLHHPVNEGVVARRAALRDRDGVADAIRRSGAELVLHGHAHASAVSTLAGPGGPLPVLGVPSGSAAPGHGEAARWHLIEIEKDAGWQVSVTARGIGDGGGIAELGRYRLVPPQG